MGACGSIHHKASAMKLQVSLDHTSVIHPSPTAGNLSVMDEHLDVKPQPPVHHSPSTFSDYGSKEETFFDSQAWLDSDYEDEFMSVNGDFTPSRGNTPVHHSLTHGSPRVNAGVTSLDHNEPSGSTSQPSPTPTEKRKRLLDLFKESKRDNHDSNFEVVEPSTEDGKMGLGQDVVKPKSESQVCSKQGCFKSLISVRSTGKQKSASASPNPNPNLNRNLRGNPVVG